MDFTWVNKAIGAMTYLDPEERAYPHGGFTRHAKAVLRYNPHNPLELPYGTIRACRCSVPNTVFTIPARMYFQGRTVRGFLSMIEEVLTFTPARAMTKAQRGSVSSGTLRAEDLGPCFLDELSSHNHPRWKELNAEWHEADDSTVDDGIAEEIQADVLDKIFDAMNDLAPRGCYFGAHEGDGADFGFWKCEEWE